MRKWLWVVVTAGVLAGCKRDEPAVPAGPERVMADEEASPESATAESLDDTAPYVLTQAKLDAYVTYQRAVQASYAAMAKELQAVRARLQGTAGPENKAPGVGESMKAIESKAELEIQARRDASLSEVDVNRIGVLVTDVITQRHMAAMLDLASELRKLQDMQAKLKPEQAAELAPQIDILRQRVQETEQLVSVRKAHGDANVDLVLTREKDLMINYQDMLRSFGGKAQ